MPLVAHVTLDSATWAALALVLTVVGGALSWVAWRRRGIAAGLRGLAWTLVPVAAWLTGTLKLAANIVNDVLDWAARLAFSPSVWLGIVVAGVAVALWFGSGLLKARGIGTRGEKRAAVAAGQDQGAKAVKPTRRKPAKDDLEDLDDIEAILKRHGI
ncbi:MAG: hypothetical protein JWR90_3961 [Marmoricola sp.]|jgi:predicted permease|nr:hypothetical protein [Marmoricola sp.]